LETLFTTVLGEYYQQIPNFQERLGARLTQSYEELKKEVISGESVMVVALSPGALSNKYVALLSAKVDRNNQAVVVMYAAVTAKCRGHKVFHLLAAALYSELVKAQVRFDQVYFVVDAENEKVLGASVNKYHFVETEQEIFEAMPRSAGHKTLVCKESSFKKLREVLSRAVPNITSGKAATEAKNQVLGEGGLMRTKKAGRPKKDETFRRILEVAQTSGKSVTSLAELALVVPAFASTLFPPTPGPILPFAKVGGQNNAKKVAKKYKKTPKSKKKRTNSFNSDDNGTEKEEEEEDEDEEGSLSEDSNEEGDQEVDGHSPSPGQSSSASASPRNLSTSSSASTAAMSLSSPLSTPGTVTQTNKQTNKQTKISQRCSLNLIFSPQ